MSAPPAQDERVWEIERDTDSTGYAAQAIVGPDTEAVEVVPASELARVREERDALKEVARIHREIRHNEHVARWHAPDDTYDCAVCNLSAELAEVRAALAASETGDPR